MSLNRKHLLGLRDVGKHEIDEILSTGAIMKQVLAAPNKKTPHLVGKSIVTLFYENSTRTRMSFELAAKFMSASASNISAAASSITKGETLIDTGKTLDALGTDVIIMRHPMSGAAHILSQHVNAAVINAGDGMNEHPTQALLDMYTMKEKKGDIKGLKVAIVGDVLHSRVARSNAWGLKTMGADVTYCAATTLMPLDFEQIGVKTTNNLKEAVKSADVVMGLRIQRERQQAGLFPSVREYNKFFALSEDIIALADKDCIVMHPGPMNRGVEINSNVADADNAVIQEQVTNGLAIRMALLYLLTRRA